jgi:hypothetical protein
MTPFEILAGPYTLWLAPVGTVFPLITAVPAVAWVKIGTNGDVNYDDDGITVSHVAKQEVARPAGRTGQVKAWTTEEDLMLSLKLWDVSLEQYATALNKATVTTVAAGVSVAGTKKIGLNQGAEVTAYALLARGLSPYGDGFSMQYEVPRCFQSANAKPVFKKGKPATLDLEFTALEDLAAASAAERFGRLVAQHQAAL